MGNIKRKVIKLAQKTFVISLPAAWCRTNNINKGDELYCEDHRSRLIITKASQDRKSHVEIDGDSLGVLMKRVLNELYHAGTDRVTIHAKKPETVQYINQALNQLLGYHIIEQKGHTLVIEDLVKKDQDFSVLLRRLLLLVKTMLDDSTQTIQKQDISFESIAARDIDVNKFSHLCMRALNRQQLPAHEAARLHTLIYQVEQLGDDIKNVLMQLKTKPSIIPELKDGITAAAELYESAYNFLFQRTTKNAHIVARANDKAKDVVNNIPSNNENEFALIRLKAFVKKAVSIQELFLHDLQDVHRDKD